MRELGDCHLKHTAQGVAAGMDRLRAAINESHIICRQTFMNRSPRVPALLLGRRIEGRALQARGPSLDTAPREGAYSGRTEPFVTEMREIQ